MPTITDATVVAQVYDTSGNGGRKLVRLNDNSQVAVVKDISGLKVRLYRTTDDWTTKTEIRAITIPTSLQDACIETDGNNIFLMYGKINQYITFHTIKPDGSDIISSYIVQTETTLGNVSLAINEAKTELHATWASKNSTYPNSFNIRYAKGTINADGTVTWGAVEQWTTNNTAGQDNENPSIIVAKQRPIIFSDLYLTSSQPSYILAMSTTGMANAPSSTIAKSYSFVYNAGNGYAQSSPSAIFVPQSINGLANGRIWVAWHGTDATDTTSPNVRVSYSDDLGVTWITPTKITNGNSYANAYPSISFDKTGILYLTFIGSDATSNNNIFYSKNTNNSWSSRIKISTSANSQYPNSLGYIDTSSSIPLFIYKDVANSRVGFYGIWTVTTISVTPGDIGQKTDKNNILSYSITTDGEMSTITEKINGTVVNTRNTTSGQAVTLGLTQAQWDAIRFGKYVDATGGKNTLTVEMGSEKWTYTFDKQLASDSDIISASKAVKDANEVYLPSVKKQLADAINAKGGSVSANADWLTMIGELNGVSSGRKASGTITSSSSSKTYTLYNGSASSYYYITLDISVLGFIPSVILVTQIAKVDASVTVWTYENFLSNGTTTANMVYSSSSMKNQYTGVPLDLAVSRASNQYNWIAYE